MAHIIDGKAISAAVRGEIKENTQALIAKTGVTPGLAVIIVGEDPASQVYVRNKRRACEEVGFYSEAYELPAETTQAELETLLDKLNADPRIHG
ncbi:MAG: bifunctional 5,10-methylene-tetrahydrofolate dehydrogenase/5,10-methylene-tetrahydrofolate cyclohydrolase, partial [Clostridia bacterium]|nr:bifunctional 5,10-methylene-tetrahydrofolate dehydrogenase/5,10-methylene-tetrahydrofolate cyclohydrolase [Clostridia bacterium]